MKDGLKHDQSLEALQSSARLALLLICLLATDLNPLSAAPSVHLLGFVDTLCNTEPHCFDLLVEPEYQDQLGQHIKVRFNADTRIFDPENYELTLLQQNIVPGSHLRLLIEPEVENEVPGASATYRASFIWIGD
jgi:hypothetical protein